MAPHIPSAEAQRPIHQKGLAMKTKTIAAALSAFLAVSAPAFGQDIVLEIGSTAPANSPWDVGVRKIAAEWSKVSGGRVKVVFPKSVAGSSQEDLIQKLKFSLDGAVLDTTGMSFIERDAMLLSMPSVIRNDADWDLALKAAIPLLQAKVADRYVILGVSKAGWIRFFSNKPIEKPEDLRNLRMGVNRNMDALAKLFQSLGSKTVLADSSSTYLQFSSGSMDAMYSSPLFVAALWSQYRRVVTHMSALKVAPFFGAVVLSKRAWDRVPEALRPALREAAERVSAEIGAETARLEDEAIASMVKGGLKVPGLDSGVAKAWDALYADKVRPVIDELYSPAFVAAVYKAMGR